MKPLWVIARREFAGVFTERTILLAVIIQVFVAGFSSFLVVGLSALFDPSAMPGQAPSVIAVDPEANADVGLLDSLSHGRIRFLAAESRAEALTLFDRGIVDGVLLKDPHEAGDPVRFTIILPDGQLQATLTLVQIKEVLEAYERALRDERQADLVSEPLYVDSDVRSGSFGFVYSLLIPLLVFLPVVLSGALTADSITEEVQRGTLPLLLASPATASDVIHGKLLANVTLTPLLTLAWFGLLALNGLTVPWQGALAILILGSAVAFLMGLLACVISLATRDRNKTHLLYAAAMFFLLGLSLALPASPVNAVAVFAAGSPNPAAYATLAACVLASVVGALLLRMGLRRSSSWMAAGT